METRFTNSNTVTLADMHMDGVYFDPKILAALKAKKTLPKSSGN